MSKFAEVIVLQPGYAIWEKKLKAQRADGTITLVKSHKNIIIDTGLPKDKEVILNSLKQNGFKVGDIDYVVCTHGDADHISNNNLFPHAPLIVGFDIYTVDVATFFQENYKIDDNITVTSMIGHDDRSIGVLVKAKAGLVAVTGDLFEAENDWQNAKDWIAFSKRPKAQIKNRAKVWELADYIIPGHGDMFKVDKAVNILAKETAQLKKLLQTSINVYGDVEL
jgi:glyoxylase-like metal-dependent hydrolase (beta-lactamase superfamily II)